jgi:preprotein translocase subunit SecG
VSDGFAPYIQVIQIIISVALVAIILVQAKGSGGLGGIFGGEGRGVYRTRRGVEKTLFTATIGLAVLFLVFSVLSVLAAK